MPLCWARISTKVREPGWVWLVWLWRRKQSMLCLDHPSVMQSATSRENVWIQSVCHIPCVELLCAVWWNWYHSICLAFAVSANVIPSDADLDQPERHGTPTLWVPEGQLNVTLLAHCTCVTLLAHYTLWNIPPTTVVSGWSAFVELKQTISA